MPDRAGVSGGSRVPARLAAAYCLVWLAAAVAPTDRQTWLLENLIVFAAAPILVAVHRRLGLSNASYVLIFVFLVLHAIGSHYTYSEVPAGNWLRDALGLARNPYDRVVHFAFGLLLTGPIRELALRRLHLRRAAGYLIPVLVLVSLSATYEIVESWAARLFDPRVGIAYVGAQGDVWDAQKDMSLALLGALVAMAAAFAARRWTGREPFLPRIR